MASIHQNSAAISLSGELNGITKILNFSEEVVRSNWTEFEKQMIADKWDIMFSGSKEKLTFELDAFSKCISYNMIVGATRSISNESSNFTDKAPVFEKSIVLINKYLGILNNIRALAKSKDTSMPGTYSAMTGIELSTTEDKLLTLETACIRTNANVSNKA
jgi:hypothetical protein